MRGSCWLALALVACAASEESPSRVVVIIDAEPGVKEQAAELALIVTDLSDGEARAIHDDTEAPASRMLPHRIALVPTGGDASRTYRLQAHAVANKQTIAVARLISGYVANETRYVRILLEDACIGKPCSDDETCNAGACVSAESPADKFSRDELRAPVSTSLGEKGVRPVPELPQPGIDAAVPDARADEPDAAMELPDAELTGSDGEVDAEPGMPDAAVATPDSAMPDAAVDAQVVDSGPVQPVCGGSTPKGCFQVSGDSPPECPQYYPGEATDCLGKPILVTCNYNGPQGQTGSCTCDWYHWLCL